jgi:hypothetical protein
VLRYSRVEGDAGIIIKRIKLTRTGEATVLSAQCKIRKIGWDTVYFSLNDTAQGAYVYDDASPFAAALLLPSMKQGEDLIIQGSISERLYNGMHAVMHEVLRWNIGLKPVEIQADSVVADTHEPHRTASFFSGGVDSFYTYLKHKQDPVRADRVDSLILVNGFDVDRRNTQLWKRALTNIRAIASAENVELVVVRTNIQGLVEPVLVWDYTHGGCLAAVGLFLRGAFRRVYIPSTHSVDEQIPWGSNLALDGHWSTESTTFVHDGSEATRINKVISQIAQSPLALDHLRVCYENERGAYNCGRCDKCLRTMINLYIAGSLEKSKTFPHRIDPELVAAVPTTAGEHGGIFHDENLRALRERNLAPDLQRAITVSLNNTIVAKSGLAANIEERMIYLDHVYTSGYARSVWNRLFGRRFS